MFTFSQNFSKDEMLRSGNDNKHKAIEIQKCAVAKHYFLLTAG